MSFRIIGIGRKALGIAVLLFGCGSLLAQDATENPKEKEREQELVTLANQARQDAGAPPLQWDAGLAAAAHAHALRMVAEGQIAHQYGGESDLPQRASQAGAMFSLIEENVAMGDTARHIHESWMKSPGHHDNLVNPKVDRVGVALVESKGYLFAVADYAQGVVEMKPNDVEVKVGEVLTKKGVTLLADNSGARQYCGQESNSDESTGPGIKPRFLMKWQSAEITNLPPELEKALASGQFKQATVGACPAQGGGANGSPEYSGYRVAVLLY